LPALDAAGYVQGANWLGVALAALMKFPKERIAWLGAEALRRITEAPLFEQKRFLLGECVQSYLPLDEQRQQEFQRLLATEVYGEVQAMNTTWYEKGVEKGHRDVLQEQLEERLGPLSPTVLERLERWPIEQVIASGKAGLRAQSLRDLGLED
jgi:hypothetical protein